MVLGHGDVVHRDAVLAEIFNGDGRCCQCLEPVGQILLQAYSGKLWYRAERLGKDYRVHVCTIREAGPQAA